MQERGKDYNFSPVPVEQWRAEEMQLVEQKKAPNLFADTEARSVVLCLAKLCADLHTIVKRFQTWDSGSACLLEKVSNTDNKTMED